MLKQYLFLEKKKMTLLVFIMPIHAFLQTLSAYGFQRMTDSILERDSSSIIGSFILVISIILFSMTTFVVKNIVFHQYLSKSLLLVKNRIFKNILNRHVVEFNERNIGEYNSSLVNNINELKYRLFIPSYNLAYSVILILASSIYLITIDYRVLLLVMILIFINIKLSFSFGNKIEKKNQSYIQSSNIFSSKINNFLLGFEVLKSFNVDKKISDDFKKINEDVEQNRFNVELIKNLVDGVVSFSSSFTITIPWMIGAYLYYTNTISMGKIMAISQLTNLIATPLMNLLQNYNETKTGIGIVKEIEKLSTVKPVKKRLQTLDSLRNSIELKNFSFSYDTKPALDNISYCFEKNKKYAIVGSSGSGKTTLMKLILQYYDNYQGNLFFDNKEAKELKIKDINNIVSVIHQNVYLFNDTIKNNIILDKNYSEKELSKAIELSGINDFIDEFEDGLDTLVKENSNNISGGQKQRIAIARSFIKNNDVIIVDEGTSSLDNNSSFYIENALLNKGGITLISITHKLNSKLLEQYDEILVLNHGKLVEAGGFKELLELKGYFYNLYYFGRGDDS
ncbi:ABC transporter ATP-binding protein/permease [Fusobacteria bacterium ZRK30]|nr:ABC transporter ATP-binding protein/permease [Fusobacteria bacterium ZRK30]